MINISFKRKITDGAFFTDLLLAGSLTAETIDDAVPIMGCKERGTIFIYIRKR